jgi:hypothetical protein
MKKTADTIMVQPINKTKLLAHLLNFITPGPGEIINTENGAIYDDNVIVDTDCCWFFVPQKLYEGKIQLTHDVPVYVEIETSTGRRIPAQPNYYINVTMDKIKELCEPEIISLRDYMGGRYNYNPRITTNIKSFCDCVNLSTQ